MTEDDNLFDEEPECTVLAPEDEKAYNKVQTSPAQTALTVDLIKKYINKDATDEEAYMFQQLCQARKLNPFLKEAYLIKYSKKDPASMVVGKDAFTRIASAHPQFDGYEAGVIIVDEFDVVQYRPGAFYTSTETLIGGWAEVYRKDHEKPIRIEVNLRDFIKNTHIWRSMPGIMIRKVALIQALRESFTAELGGMYDQAEISISED